MNKKRLSGALLVAAALCLIASATHAAPLLSLDTATAQPGDTVSLILSLSGGTEPYAGFNARINVPSGMAITNVAAETALSAGYAVDWEPFSIRIAPDGSGLLALLCQGDRVGHCREYERGYAGTPHGGLGAEPHPLR